MGPVLGHPPRNGCHQGRFEVKLTDYEWIVLAILDRGEDPTCHPSLRRTGARRALSRLERKGAVECTLVNFHQSSIRVTVAGSAALWEGRKKALRDMERLGISLATIDFIAGGRP
jgi:hypothetical protein